MRETLPLLTAALPGTGGRPVEPEDFVVEEIPAYLPCGSGEHCFVLVEKRGLTTQQAITRLCSVLSVSPASVGCAGLKDRHAVTRQWLSVAGVTPAALLARRAELEASGELEVIEAALHRNKLKTGHLRGNRFAVVLRNVLVGGGGDVEVALRRAVSVMQVLERDGLPNFYGPQRFGASGDNAERARRALAGEASLPRDRQQRRLLISALQSAIFNAALADRVAQRTLRTLLGGEVLQKTASGGLFISEDRELDQLRLDRGEVVITGPICGPRMPRPKPGSVADAREAATLAGLAVVPEDLGRFGRLARGGRRPLTVAVAEPSVRLVDGPALEVRFCLPAGSYATVLLRELTKAD